MKVLYRLALSRVGRWIIGWVFACMSFVIPVKRLRETPSLIAFFHPKPSYPLHILLVPKKALGGLADLTAADADFLTDLFQTVKTLVAEFDLERVGYRLIANGGPYQDVAHLHFHLISKSSLRDSD